MKSAQVRHFVQGDDMNTFAAWQEIFHTSLDRFCRHIYGGDSDLHRACTYALQGGGKRVRPLLVTLSNQACGGNPDHAMLPALAVELVHTYSLVHDDLPALDNDTLRRGRPTVHVQFSESTALLTGDALLSDAFSLFDPDLGRALGYPSTLSSPQYLAMSLELARAIGGSGMVLGQFEDVACTGGDEGTFDTLLDMHRKKTGKLMGAACVLGGLSANASVHQLTTLRTFGENLGIWFQLQDDALDGTPENGKTPHKDLEQGKLTLQRFGDAAQAQQILHRYESQVRTAAAQLDPLGHGIQQLVELLAHRRR